MRVLFAPDYTTGTPDQQLLAQALGELGVQVEARASPLWLPVVARQQVLQMRCTVPDTGQTAISQIMVAISTASAKSAIGWTSR